MGLCLLAVLVVALGAGGMAATASAGTTHHSRACDQTSGGASCMALVVNQADGTPMTTAGPQGLSPTTIKSVYNFTSDPTAGAGQTVAVVTAYNAPTIGHDLGVFSSQFGLPCDGCFKKVNQTGGRNFPVNSPGWALEASLDVEWVHAIAPGAKILLVEANNPGMGNLAAAVDYAKNHANYVSMSWGATEYRTQTGLDKHYQKPGVTFFAAAGDVGGVPIYPSTSPAVVSVGGTYLNYGTRGLNDEWGWSDGGGGCSRFEKATAAQQSFAGYSCGGSRSTPDISYDASPDTGVSVYDSTTVHKHKGWFQVGGTSLSTPIAAGHAATVGSALDASTIYNGSMSLRDITVGYNGYNCASGYELCTGRGSWLG